MSAPVAPIVRTIIGVLREQLDRDFARATCADSRAAHGVTIRDSAYARTVEYAQRMVYPPEAWDLVYDIVNTYLQELER